MTYSKSADNDFTIYHRKGPEIAHSLIVSLIPITLGAALTFYMKEESSNYASKLGGVVLMAVGLFCLISLPKYFRRVFSNGGAALLKVTAQGIGHSPRVNDQAIHYSWAQIAAIHYAEVFVENSENGALFYKSHLIVIFDRAKLPTGATADYHARRSTSPTGKPYIAVPIPRKEDLHAILNSIETFLPALLALNYCKKIDFSTTTEQFL